jgi:hypothetical protein
VYRIDSRPGSQRYRRRIKIFLTSSAYGRVHGVYVDFVRVLQIS